MGNGTIIYGAPMTWDEVCQLVNKYIEKHPDSLKRKGFRVGLLRLSIQDAREAVPIKNSNHAFIEAQKHDVKLAIEMIENMSKELLDQRIRNIISSVFVKDRFDLSDSNSRLTETFDRLSECLSELFEVSVRKHGPCCIEDLGQEFFIGDEGDGGIYRGEPSCPIKLPTKEMRDFVDKLFALIEKEATYYIVATDCDSCT
jgi:hypothetical protein